MFCDRARARDPAFTLDESNARPCAEICRRLDGLPLALELAAARAGCSRRPSLPRGWIARSRVLVGGARDAPKRQRTLRATIDWSYDLLTSEERSAFAHMAVFAGGATVAAAETVTGASLDTLDSLVAKQLLARRDERLLMLETVREYALERLAEDPGADDAQDGSRDGAADSHARSRPSRPRGPSVLAGEARRRTPQRPRAALWAPRERRAAPPLPLAGELGEYGVHKRSEDGLPGSIPPSTSPPALPTPPAPRRCSTGRDYRLRLVATAHHPDLQASLAHFRAGDDAAGIADCLGELAYAETGRGNSRGPRRSASKPSGTQSAQRKP